MEKQSSNTNRQREAAKEEDTHSANLRESDNCEEGKYVKLGDILDFMGHANLDSTVTKINMEILNSNGSQSLGTEAPGHVERKNEIGP